MATLRELKGRIGSVSSSEKITGAMKMISSAKMHKAEASLRRQVPFRRQIETIIGNLLSSDAVFSSPLVTERQAVKNILIVVWGSDDGLCGAYNVNLYKVLVGAIGELKAKYPEAGIRVMPIGKKMGKAVGALRIEKVATVKAPEGLNSKSEGEAVDKFMMELQKCFTEGEYDRVEALYMNFQSAGRQRARREQLLPVLQESFVPQGKKVVSGRPYLFEPNPNAIFNSVLPMFLMSTMQNIFSENQASEQAARVMAMQSANDNAKSLLEQLQLEYNKLRQQSITSELLDIVGGQIKE